MNINFKIILTDLMRIKNFKVIINSQLLNLNYT